MSGSTPTPEWGPLYQKHKDAMYRVAASVLREGGIADQAADAVQDAMVSLMSSPPEKVKDWEALMVSTAKRRALDRLDSAAVRHAGPELSEAHDQAGDDDIAADVAEAIDRLRRAGVVWDKLAILEDRERRILWEYVALERSRAEVAAEFDISASRVSQIVKSALQKVKAAMPDEEVNDDE